MIALAKKIAFDAHDEQKRSGGEPYIVHPEAVANSVEDRLKPIAWLHDVIEDTHVTLKDLQLDGFDSYVILAIDILTHKNGVPNIEYWNKIATNPDAVKVKLADIAHNLSSNPSDHAKEKYKRALEVFKKLGYNS